MAELEDRHRSGGDALRAAVLEANNALVSNLSLVTGVAGACAPSDTILLTGLVEEWLSVMGAREMNSQQIAGDADELDRMPSEEREEAQAHALADKSIGDKQTALDTLAREKRGIVFNDLSAAAASFFLFVIGVIFPVAPYFWLSGWHALIASLATSGSALVAIGACISLFTGRSLWFSALRTVLIGFTAAAVTFGVGKLVGVSLSG